MFIIISSSSSIFFFVLLNCLYLNPLVSLFVYFSSPSCWVGRGGVSERLSGAGLTATELNHNKTFLQYFEKVKCCILNLHIIAVY